MPTQPTCWWGRTFPIADIKYIVTWHSLHIFVLFPFSSFIKTPLNLSLSLSLYIHVSSSSLSHLIPFSLPFHFFFIFFPLLCNLDRNEVVFEFYLKPFQAMDLASNLGGKIEKAQVLSAVDKCVSLSKITAALWI